MIKQKRALVTNVALGMGLFLVGCASPVGEASPIGTSASAIDDRDQPDIPHEGEELYDPEQSEAEYGPEGQRDPLDPYGPGRELRAPGDQGPYGPGVGGPPLDEGPYGPGMGDQLPVDEGEPGIGEEPLPDEGRFAPGMGDDVPMEEEGEPLEQGADEVDEGATGTVESEIRRFPHRHRHPHWGPGRHGHWRHPRWGHPHRHWDHRHGFPHRHWGHRHGFPHRGWDHRHW